MASSAKWRNCSSQSSLVESSLFRSQHAEAQVVERRRGRRTELVEAAERLVERVRRELLDVCDAAVADDEEEQEDDLDRATVGGRAGVPHQHDAAVRVETMDDETPNDGCRARGRERLHEAQVLVTVLDPRRSFPAGGRRRQGRRTRAPACRPSRGRCTGRPSGRTCGTRRRAARLHPRCSARRARRRRRRDRRRRRSPSPATTPRSSTSLRTKRSTSIRRTTGTR